MTIREPSTCSCFLRTPAGKNRLYINGKNEPPPGQNQHTRDLAFSKDSNLVAKVDRSRKEDERKHAMLHEAER